MCSRPSLAGGRGSLDHTVSSMWSDHGACGCWGLGGVQTVVETWQAPVARGACRSWPMCKVDAWCSDARVVGRNAGRRRRRGAACQAAPRRERLGDGGRASEMQNRRRGPGRHAPSGTHGCAGRDAHGSCCTGLLSVERLNAAPDAEGGEAPPATRRLVVKGLVTVCRGRRVPAMAAPPAMRLMKSQTRAGTPIWQLPWWPWKSIEDCGGQGLRSVGRYKWGGIGTVAL